MTKCKNKQKETTLNSVTGIRGSPKPGWQKMLQRKLSFVQGVANQSSANSLCSALDLKIFNTERKSWLPGVYIVFLPWSFLLPRSQNPSQGEEMAARSVTPLGPAASHHLPEHFQ